MRPSEIPGIGEVPGYGAANVETFAIVVAWLALSLMIGMSAALFWISQR